MAFVNDMKDLANQGLEKAKDLSEIGVAKAKVLVAEAKMKDVALKLGEAMIKAEGKLEQDKIDEFMKSYQDLKAEVEKLNASVAKAPAAEVAEQTADGDSSSVE